MVTTTKKRSRKETLRGGIGDTEARTKQKGGRKQPLDVQGIVDRLVAKHGANLANRADFAELLGQEDLDISQVTEGMIEKANQKARDALKIKEHKEQQTGRVLLSELKEGDFFTLPRLNVTQGIVEKATDDGVVSVRIVRQGKAQRLCWSPEAVVFQSQEQYTIELGDTKNLIWQEPVAEKSDGVSTFLVWPSICGRYRVARISGPSPRFMASHRNGDGQDRVIANDLRSLDRAFEEAEKHFTVAAGKPPEECNSYAMSAKAEEQGLHKLEPSPYTDEKAKERLKELNRKKKEESETEQGQPPESTLEEGEILSSSQEENVMRVAEKPVRRMLVNAGVKEASKWSAKTLVQKIHELPKLNLEGLEDAKDKALFGAISGALKEGKKIALKSSNGEAAKNGTGRTSPEKKPSSRKEGVGTDKYGSRNGTAAAEANKVLSKKPKTMSKIMEEAKITNSVYSHLGKLVKLGIVEKTDDGAFKLK